MRQWRQFPLQQGTLDSTWLKLKQGTELRALSSKLNAFKKTDVYFDTQVPKQNSFCVSLVKNYKQKAILLFYKYAPYCRTWYALRLGRSFGSRQDKPTFQLAEWLISFVWKNIIVQASYIAVSMNRNALASASGVFPKSESLYFLIFGARITYEHFVTFSILYCELSDDEKENRMRSSSITTTSLEKDRTNANRYADADTREIEIIETIPFYVSQGSRQFSLSCFVFVLLSEFA